LAITCFNRFYIITSFKLDCFNLQETI